MKLGMEHFWHPLAPLEEATDQPKPFTLLGERIVAFRDGSGFVALKDQCVHRGAALSGGRLVDGRLVCPYHGWQYDRSGACVHIPSLPDGSAIPSRARTETYRTRAEYGLLWVAIREPAQPFPTWPANAWSNPAYKVFLINSYVWNTSAGRAVENAMDFSHFNFVHKNYTELEDGPIIKPHEVERTATGLAFAYEDGRIRREYSLHFPFVLHDRKQFMKQGKGTTWSESAHGSAPGEETILTFIASPIDAQHTRLYFFMGRNHSLDQDDRSFVGGFDAVMDQDRVVVESQRPIELPIDPKGELHLRYPDAAAVLYRRLFRELDKVEVAQAV